MKPNRFRILLASALLSAAAATAVQGDGLIIVSEPVVVRRDHHAFAPLHVRKHHVEVEIKDQVAVTAIDQVFYNPSERNLEGTYIFPVPDGAQIDRFTMDINGQPVEAELLDADKARRLYEEIVRKMRDPALLEYAGRGLFKVRIFPIEPKSEKHITLKYTELLKSESGLVEYIYPLNTEKYSSEPTESVALRVRIESDRGLGSVYSPSHEIEVKRDDANRATAGFEAANVRPDVDFHLFYALAPERPGDPGISLLACTEEAESQGYFLMLVAPSARAQGEAPLPKDIVFALDTSGSMAGAKLEQAKRALKFCLANLNEADRFELVRFSTLAEPFFNGLTDATEANRRKAAEFIDGLKPIGGTAIAEALLQALRPGAERAEAGRPYMVIFLTDGRPTIGVTEADKIVRLVKETVGEATRRVFCFGIGTDINTHLLDRITRETKAVSQYVLPEEDIEVRVSNFYTKIAEPVLAGVTIAFASDADLRTSEIYPSPLPDLFRGDQLVLVGRYTGAAQAQVVVEGNVGTEPRRFAYAAAFPRTATEHTFIPRLWATRRVGHLLDELRLHGENDELRDEVSTLARKYGIVTPYTSYLILEDEEQRAVPMSVRVTPPPALAPEPRAEGRAAYDALRRAESGPAAVGGAAATGALRGATTMAAPAMAADVAFRGMEADAKARGAAPAAAAPSESRFAGGRTFYRAGDLWIDASVQDAPIATLKQLIFGSDEYFALLAAHPETREWLALGRHVKFRLADVVYEIVEE